MLYRTFWLRAGAVLMDALVLLPVVIIDLMDLSRIWMAAASIVQHAYSIVAHALYGQTVGKWAVGVKVVRAHEHLLIGWPHAFMREIYWIAVAACVLASEHSPLENYGSGLAVAMVVCNVLVAAIHPRNRAIHDFMAKTVVIRVR